MSPAGAVDFQTAYRELYPSLHRYVLRMTGDPDVAEDVVQEAFTRLVEQDLPLEEARPWLHVVAANLVRAGAIAILLFALVRTGDPRRCDRD